MGSLSIRSPARSLCSTAENELKVGRLEMGVL